MKHLQARSLNHPDSTQEFPNGVRAQVRLADRTVTRTEYRAGWRWSNDVQPIVGGGNCQIHHVGSILGGALHVETDAMPVSPSTRVGV